MMSPFKHATLAAAAIACLLSVPALAQDKMMVVSPNGQMSSMAMPDKATMDMMMKHAVPMSADMAIVVWGAKTYMVKNEKMPDGKMTFDVWGIKFER
jgi:hypothetical protein